MADYGKKILGTYSASCNAVRAVISKTSNPQAGDIVFFSGTRHDGANHIGIIYKVSGNTVYTVEGNTSGSAGVVDNGGQVATKSYAKSNSRILSYGRPAYTTNCLPEKVVQIAMGEVGYVEKASNRDLNSKTGNAGKSNFTKYGAWMGANGDYWCCSFVSWCFHAAYDDSAGDIGSPIYSGEYSEGTDDAVYGAEPLTSPNSMLATFVSRIEASNSDIRSGAVECITVHIARATGNMEKLSKMINSGQTSYNYGIDEEGTIGMFADEPIATQSSDSKKNDNRAVNIVCMNDALSPNYSLSDATYDALVALCSDVCRRNYISMLQRSAKKSDDYTLTLHSDFNPKSDCPGPWFTKRLKKFMKDVNEQLAKDWSKAEARVAQTNEAALFVQSGINMDVIKPYVLTVDKVTTTVNYSKFMEIGVVATILNAGMHYDAKHNAVPFAPSDVYKQCEAAKKAKLQFGFYWTSHARTAQEVKEEAYWLYFIISKYPPKLGIWLHCEFDVGTAMARTLVDAYYSKFVDWGLKSKCGIYATKAQAKLIGWPRQCTYMPLWLEGEMTDSTCPDDEILTPSFFNLSSLKNEGYHKGDEVTDPGSGGTPYLNDAANTPVESRVYGDFTVKVMPKTPKYTGFKKYEPYHTITSVTSRQYKITRSSKTIVDSNGFLRADGRYLIAVGIGVTGTVGTYVDIILENGTEIGCIVGDIKDKDDTDTATGEVYTNVNANWCCSEFIVDIKKLDTKVKQTGNCSYLKSTWKSPVAKMNVYKKNWFTANGD